MTQKRLLLVAAAFALFTFLGHSVGTLLPHPPATDAIRQTHELMETTMVPMPVGPSRSIAQMMYGGNVMLSVYLLMSGLLFVLLSNQKNRSRNIVLLNSVSLLLCAVFSIIFYFPVPAICTGISSLCGFVSTRLEK